MHIDKENDRVHASKFEIVHCLLYYAYGKVRLWRVNVRLTLVNRIACLVTESLGSTKKDIRIQGLRQQEENKHGGESCDTGKKP